MTLQYLGLVYKLAYLEAKLKLAIESNVGGDVR